MMKNHNQKSHSGGELERIFKRAREEFYVLRLYVTGTTPKSTSAINNVRSLCEEHLAGRYELEVIDLYQQPKEAMDADIIAAPTLVKQLPTPPKRLIGQLADRGRVLVGLNLMPVPSVGDDIEPEGGRTRWINL
jgi:circadian clock protein KaiB